MDTQPVRPNLLPRRSMREDAFRKYEHLIAMACKGSFEYDPTQLDEMKASSFMVGFREAKRGQENFNYKSSVIPQGYDLSCIKLFETESGRVWIENKWQDRQNELASKGLV